MHSYTWVGTKIERPIIIFRDLVTGFQAFRDFRSDFEDFMKLRIHFRDSKDFKDFKDKKCSRGFRPDCKAFIQVGFRGFQRF